MKGELMLRIALLLQLTSVTWAARRSRRDVLNGFVVKNRAQKKACETGACPSNECDNPEGWYLRGSDWGCCSNYEGCCKLASLFCYTHDVICRCCDYGFFCGPFCKKDTSCFPNPPAPITTTTTTTTATLQQRMMGDDGNRANQKSAPEGHVNSTSNGKEDHINPKFSGKATRLAEKDTKDGNTDVDEDDGSGEV